MKLTEQQLAFFHAFGYLVVRKLLSSNEIKQVSAAFEWTIQNRGAGHEHDGSKRTMIVGPIEEIW